MSLLKKPVFKTLALVLLICFALLLSAFILLMLFFPNDFVKNKIQTIASKSINGSLVIESLDIRPLKSISLGAVRIMDDSDMCVFKIDSLKIQYRVLSLFRRTLHITKIELDRPEVDIWLADSVINLLALLKKPEKEPLKDKQTRGFSELLEQALPLSLELDLLLLRNLGMRAALAETISVKGLDISLKDLNIRKIGAARLNLDISLSDTLVINKKLDSLSELAIRIPLNFKSSTSVKKIFKSSQKNLLELNGLEAALRTPQGRERLGAKLNLGFDNNLTVDEGLIENVVKISVTDLRLSGELQGTLPRAALIAGIRLPYGVKPEPAIKNLFLDSLKLVLTNQTVFHAQGTVDDILKDPLISVTAHKSPFSILPVISGFKHLIPAEIDGEIDLGTSAASFRPLNPGSPDNLVNLTISLKNLSVIHELIALSNVHIGTSARVKFLTDLPAVRCSITVKGLARESQFSAGLKADIPGKIEKTDINAEFTVSSLNFKDMPALNKILDGNMDASAGLEISSLNKITTFFKGNGRNIILNSGNKKIKTADFEVIHRGGYTLENLNVKGNKFDLSGIKKCKILIDSLKAEIVNVAQLSICGSLYNMGQDSINIALKSIVENKGAFAMASGFLDSSLATGNIEGSQELNVRINGRTVPPYKVRQTENMILFPFKGSLEFSHDINAFSMTLPDKNLLLKNAGGRIYFTGFSSDTGFTSALSCSLDLREIKSSALPVEQVKSIYLRCDMSSENNNSIHIRRFKAGSKSFPVTVDLNASLVNLLTNPVSDLQSRISLNAPDKIVIAGSKSLKGNSVLELNLSLPGLKNKILNIAGSLDFRDFQAALDTTLLVQGIRGRFGFQQRIDFSKVNFDSLSGVPKINLVPLAEFREDPVKSINYPEVDRLYNPLNSRQNRIFIHHIFFHSKKDYAIDSLNTELSYGNNRLNLQRLEMRMFNGSFAGHAGISFNDGRIYLPDSLLKHVSYNTGLQLNRINFDWLGRGCQDTGYFKGRNYEVDIILRLAGEDLSDVKNLNIAGNVHIPFMGPRIAKTFFRSYIDPQNKMKILSTINSFLNRGAHLESVEIPVANGRFGVNIKFIPTFLKLEVPGSYPISNVIELITLQH
ncbi:MAG: AsmA family protein [bacterium]